MQLNKKCIYIYARKKRFQGLFLHLSLEDEGPLVCY